MKKALSTLGLALLVTGCEQETQSVEWYRANDAKRMEIIRECKANPDKLGKTPNCLNAKQASRELLNGTAPSQTDAQNAHP